MAEEFATPEETAEELAETIEELSEDETVEDEFEEAVEEVEDPDVTQGITDEELDHIADTAIAFISDVLEYMNVGEVEINEYEGDEGELILDLTGDDLAILIGRHGKTLDALCVFGAERIVGTDANRLQDRFRNAREQHAPQHVGIRGSMAEKLLRVPRTRA
jgi:predicted RNA-binding protein Jag